MRALLLDEVRLSECRTHRRGGALHEARLLPGLVLRAVGSPSVMKTTRSATVPCVFASRTFVKASSQLVQPLGWYWLTR